MSDLHLLAQRLGRIADRVGDLGDRPAHRIAGLDWRCPRGRRALDRAERLGVTARRVHASLTEAARELASAADHP